MSPLAFALAFTLAGADPVGVLAGQPAPFDGVVVDADRAGELVEAEARVAVLERQLADERELTAAWKAAAVQEWWESPELNRWAGFGAGVVVAVGAVVLGAWITDVAANPPGG